MKKLCCLGISLLLLVIGCRAELLSWSNLDANEFQYAPALLQSQVSAVYYSGSYRSAGGHLFTCECGYGLIHPESVHSFDFAEVVTDRSQLNQPRSLTWLLDIFRELKFTTLALSGDIRPHGGIYAGCLARHAFDYSKLNIGQMQDVACMARAYDALSANADLVLLGFSRGAASTFNFLCIDYHSRPHKRVKAAVLSGCFDSISSVFDQYAKRSWLLHRSWGPKIYKQVARRFPSFGTNRVEPIDLVSQFPKDVPVFFITSAKDGVVPAVCTQRLVDALVSCGHKHVYYLELSHGAHARHYLNNKQAAQMVNRVVHAFYRRYNCAHMPSLASKGQKMLKQAHRKVESSQ